MPKINTSNTPICTDEEFWAAFETGQIDAIEKLNFDNHHLALTKEKKRTPLHLAVREENVELVQYLLKNGAPVNTQDKKDATPLHTAADDKNLEILTALIDAGANVHAKDENDATPLHYAAQNTHMSIDSATIIEVLMKNGADCYAEGAMEMTPVSIAQGEFKKLMQDLHRTLQNELIKQLKMDVENLKKQMLETLELLSTLKNKAEKVEQREETPKFFK